MNYKKVIIGILSFVMIMSQQKILYAQSDNAAVLTVEPSATPITKVEQDIDFLDMEPGEERATNILLDNTSSYRMTFYAEVEIIQNIADLGNDEDDGIYQVELDKDDDGQTFYSKIIGSSGVIENPTQTTQETQDTMELATLDAGQSNTITIKVALDGESLGNEYQNKQGKIKLIVYAVAQDEINQGDESNNQESSFLQINTSDATRITLYVAGAICAMIVVGGIIGGSRRRGIRKR